MVEFCANDALKPMFVELEEEMLIFQWTVRVISLAIAVVVIQGHAWGGIIIFDNKVNFLAQTGATSATTIPSTAPTSFPLDSGFTSGGLTFSLNLPDSFRFAIDDFSSRFSGNELAISGPESFNIDIDSGPAFSLGFEFVEPEFDPNVNGPFIDSTFSVVLKNGASTVGSFSFSRPNDSAQFVGIWAGTNEAFDRVEIRETTGGVGNEYFGQFYTGDTAEPSAVPEPGSLLLLSIGAVVLMCFGSLRKRKRVFAVL